MDWKDERYREIYEAGRKSFYLNGGALVNPYPLSSDEYDVFERGWVQAHRSSSDDEFHRDASHTSSADGSTLADKYHGMGKNRPSEPVLPKYNAYAAAKGKG